MDLTAYLSLLQKRIDDYMHHILPSTEQQPYKLNQAIHYSIFNGGKRIRPILVYATGEAFGVNLDQLDACACAIEFIHCYSLVHDDLPAMDNSPLRRGKPSCHKAFDEATAILVGDALLAEAFVQLTKNDNPTPTKQRLQMVSVLAKACGTQGMVAGQILDLDNTKRYLSLEELNVIYQWKTSALIEASLLMGALTCPNINDHHLQLLSQLGQSLGLAFQIIDDILDVTQTSESLGKPQGIDNCHEKTTYVSLLGIEGATRCAKEEIEKVHFLLAKLNMQDNILAKLANYILIRQQ